LPETIEIVVVETLRERRVGEQFIPPPEYFLALRFSQLRGVASLGGEQLAAVFIQPRDETGALDRGQLAHGGFDFGEGTHGRHGNAGRLSTASAAAKWAVATRRERRSGRIDRSIFQATTESHSGAILSRANPGIVGVSRTRFGETKTTNPALRLAINGPGSHRKTP
jgi:hypothetical protein